MSNTTNINDFLNTLAQQDANNLGVNSDNSPPFVVDHDRQLIEKAGRVGLFTTNSCVIPNWKIARTFPLITTRRIFGVNIWQDFVVALRDIVGGRSCTAENLFEKLEREMLQELKIKAAAIDCHVVLGVSVQFGELAGGGKAQMLYAAAQGTPVQLEFVSSA